MGLKQVEGIFLHANAEPHVGEISVEDAEGAVEDFLKDKMTNEQQRSKGKSELLSD